MDGRRRGLVPCARAGSPRQGERDAGSAIPDKWEPEAVEGCQRDPAIGAATVSLDDVRAESLYRSNNVAFRMVSVSW